MPRLPRIDIPDHFYHVINRTNFKLQMFNSDSDYIEFIKIIRESLEVAPVKIYAYCLMPNHWHFVISPYEEGGIARFMHALTNKHTRRYHAKTKTIGFGSLYQSRYKSMMIDSDVSLLKVLRYVERNPVRAEFVLKPDEWSWGSSWLRKYGNERQRLILEDVPREMFEDFGDIFAYIDLPDNKDDLKMIRNSIFKRKPFGREKWVHKMINDYGLETTARNTGRPNNYNPLTQQT